MLSLSSDRYIGRSRQGELIESTNCVPPAAAAERRAILVERQCPCGDPRVAAARTRRRVHWLGRTRSRLSYGYYRLKCEWTAMRVMAISSASDGVTEDLDRRLPGVFVARRSTRVSPAIPGVRRSRSSGHRDCLIRLFSFAKLTVSGRRRCVGRHAHAHAQTRRLERLSLTFPERFSGVCSGHIGCSRSMCR